LRRTPEEADVKSSAAERKCSGFWVMESTQMEKVGLVRSALTT